MKWSPQIAQAWSRLAAANSTRLVATRGGPAAGASPSPVGVVEVQAGAGVGHEAHAVPGGPAGRGQAVAADPDRRAGLLRRRRPDHHVVEAEVPARIREGLTPPGQLQDLDGLVGASTALALGHTEHGELIRLVAGREPHVEPAAGELVDDREGCEVITKFPAEELLVAGRKYWTAGGQLNTLRNAESHLNTPAGRGETRTSGAAVAEEAMAGNPVAADGAAAAVGLAD